MWITNFGLHCVAIYRLGNFSRRVAQRNLIIGLPLILLHRPLNFLMRLVHHVDIDDADIGPGFYIGHVGTIYIGPTKIGANVNITHNVTIGVGHSKDEKGIPIIGDNVWIGAGSVIHGNISVGNRVTISSGCILSRSVPDGCLVVGNPGRVTLKEYDNSKLLLYSITTTQLK
ncbi:MAG: serine acetyltransferase [candidate division Zixibacteria bacterium]|nr:serine acetyltransferase [candidate division Zixibacteria bacterium]